MVWCCLDDLVSRSFTILCQKLSVSLRKLRRWQQLDELSLASSCAMRLMASMASHTLLVIKHCWITALQQEQIKYITWTAGHLLDSGVLSWTCNLDEICRKTQSEEIPKHSHWRAEKSLLNRLGSIQNHQSCNNSMALSYCNDGDCWSHNIFLIGGRSAENLYFLARTVVCVPFIFFAASNMLLLCLSD